MDHAASAASRHQLLHDVHTLLPSVPTPAQMPNEIQNVILVMSDGVRHEAALLRRQRMALHAQL